MSKLILSERPEVEEKRLALKVEFTDYSDSERFTQLLKSTKELHNLPEEAVVTYLQRDWHREYYWVWWEVTLP